MSGEPSTSAHRVPTGRRLLIALTLTVVALAVGAFTLSFDALRALAITAGVTAHLAWLWPLIVDGFIVIATAAAVMLRDHGWRVAWYPWATLVLFAGVSVAGNAQHAASHADRTAVSVSIAALVSAVPAVALLLASHLLVVLLTAYPPTTEGPEEMPAASATPDVVTTDQSPTRISSQEPLPPQVHSQTTTEPARVSRTTRRSLKEHDLETWITTRLARGEPVTGTSIAQHFDCSPATGRRRLAELRQASPELARHLEGHASSQKVAAL